MKNKNTEQWKPVKGAEGIYEYSNFGRVKSLSRDIENGPGTTYRSKEFIKTLSKTSSGYIFTAVRINNKNHSLYKHILTWQWHNGDVPKGHQIHHIDENKNNNDISNLECLENRIHLHRHKRASNSSVQGVYRCKGKYAAGIGYKGRNISLGLFETQEEAGSAYAKALQQFNEGIDLNEAYPKKRGFNKYPGITYNKIHNKWVANIKLSVGKWKYIGLFETEEEAFKATTTTPPKQGLRSRSPL